LKAFNYLPEAVLDQMQLRLIMSLMPEINLVIDHIYGLFLSGRQGS